MRFRLLEGVAAIVGEGETHHAPDDMPRVLIWRGLAFLRYDTDDAVYGDGRAVYRCVHAELLGYYDAMPPAAEAKRWASPTQLAQQITAAPVRDILGQDPWPLPRHAAQAAPEPAAFDEVVKKGRQ